LFSEVSKITLPVITRTSCK